MEAQSVKKILKENKESLIGKILKVNGTTYSTLKEFGNAILKIGSINHNYSIDLCTGDYPLNFGVKDLPHTFTRDFDTIKVYIEKIRPHIFLQPTERAIEQFGTSS